MPLKDWGEAFASAPSLCVPSPWASQSAVRAYMYSHLFPKEIFTPREAELRTP